MTIQSRASLATFLSLFVVFLAIAHRMVYVYLLSVFMGGLLALLSYPLYRRMAHRRLRPKWASFIVTLGLILLVLGPLSAFTVITIREAAALGERIARSEDFSISGLAERLQPPAALKPVTGDGKNMEKQIRTHIQGAGKYASGFIVRLATNVPDFILQLALASLACFFFLIDGPRFFAWLMAKIPLDQDMRLKLIDSFKNTALSSMWAGLSASLAQSAIMAVSFFALGVPGVVLAAGATFILSWFPLIGSMPTWIFGTIYLYSADSPGKAAVMLAAGAVTGVTDNLVRAWVLKGRDDMHPLVSLVAILGGIHMFGIMGVFVGPVLAAMFIALLNVWPEVGRRAGLHLNGEKA